MTTISMRERVARLADQWCWGDEATAKLATNTKRPELLKEQESIRRRREVSLFKAGRYIEAMRVPTPEMIRAAENELSSDGWSLMIDEAMK